MHLDPPMAVSFCDDKNGYMLSTLIDPWLLYPLIPTWQGPRNPLRFLRDGKTLGVMIKLKDEISGGISVEGKISKSLTEQDRWRLNHASNVARKILIRAGCKPDSVFVGPLRGTHPSGTVRIGELLSTQLESPVKGLYVSDASCFPEALDRPTVLTLIALSKRLAKHLLSKDKPKAKPRAKGATRKTTRKKKGADKPETPAAPPTDGSPAED
jgi:choline dehydrogenase-like flavoprotein